MSLPATDDFNRADSNTVGTNWTFQVGAVGVTSNQAVRPGSGSGSLADNYALWNADVFANDQYSQGKGYDSSFTAAPVFTVRASGSGGSSNFYQVQAYNGSHDLYKLVAGVFTSLQSFVVAPTNGDVLRVEAEGTNIRAYRNGAQLGSTVVDAALSSGSAGVRIYSEVAGVAKIDDWEGGNLSAAGPVRLLMVRF